MNTPSKLVTIVGVGALGSHVAQMLRNAALLQVIDFDRVEQKNLLSQFYGKTAVRQFKTEALRQQMDFLWGIKIAARPVKLTKDNVKTLLEKSDLVLDCLDNAEGRQVIQTYVRGVIDDGGKIVQAGHTATTERAVVTTAEVRPPCLHGALAADGQFAQGIWDEQFAIDAGATGAPTCEGGEFLPFIASAAALLASAADRFLRTGQKIGFQLHPGGVTKV